MVRPEDMLYRQLQFSRSSTEHEQFTINGIYNHAVHPIVSKYLGHKDCRNCPTSDIKSILKSPIRIKDKARLFELFEVYKITPPLTEEHLMLKYKINKLIKVYTNDYKDEENVSIGENFSISNEPELHETKKRIINSCS